LRLSSKSVKKVQEQAKDFEIKIKEKKIKLVIF